MLYVLFWKLMQPLSYFFYSLLTVPMEVSILAQLMTCDFDIPPVYSSLYMSSIAEPCCLGIISMLVNYLHGWKLKVRTVVRNVSSGF